MKRTFCTLKNEREYLAKLVQQAKEDVAWEPRPEDRVVPICTVEEAPLLIWILEFRIRPDGDYYKPPNKNRNTLISPRIPSRRNHLMSELI